MFLGEEEISFLKNKLDKMSIYEPNTGCLLWTGALNGDGYGNIVFQKKYYKAHRLSYSLHIKSIDKGMVVCHSCDTPACINPKHLFEGTQLDNIMDAKNKGRMFVKGNYCKNGHEYSAENTRLDKSYKGDKVYIFRACRKCASESWHRRKKGNVK